MSVGDLAPFIVAAAKQGTLDALLRSIST